MSRERIRSDQFATVKIKSSEGLGITLNEEQLKELADLYHGTFETFQEGKLIEGAIIKIDSDGILVDIQYKSYGLIPRYEFGEHDLKKLVVGQKIEVVLDNLENSDGNIVLSYEKAKARRAWSKIIKLYEEEQPVEGTITHKVKGGLSVDIGIPAFLPGSQIDLQRVTNFDQYVGQKITASILKVNQKRGNVIVSRRKYLNDQRSEVRKQILDTLTEEQIIQGTVKNITNYGVFIDIGGVDGLLHITDMTWGRISHPSEIVKIGNNVTVKVLSFDKDNEKISLGLKQLNPNPWKQVSDQIKVGQQIKGRISSITDYGLFIEVAKDVEGLVHISEISWTDRIANLAHRYKVGDKVDVLIVSLDADNRRMSLSIKQLEKNPWEMVDQEFKVGQQIKGKISNITDFGVFVQLLPGIDGLVHISDLSWTKHIEHPSDRYKIDDEVEAIVLAIDKENKKISLGIKQLTSDPWEQVEELYPVGTTFEGEISKITNFGAFVKLPMGIEGLVHNTTLLEEQNKKAEESFKIGEKVKFNVINVNKEERKLALSTKLTFEPKTAKEEVKIAKSKQKQPRKTTAARSSKKENITEQPKSKNSLQIALESAFKKKKDENK